MLQLLTFEHVVSTVVFRGKGKPSARWNKDILNVAGSQVEEAQNRSSWRSRVKVVEQWTSTG